jgi:hypothetical protein
MDRILRYLFCAAGVVLTLFWFTTVITGYIPADLAVAAPPPHGRIAEGMSVGVAGRPQRLNRVAIPSPKGLIDWRRRLSASHPPVSQPKPQIPAVVL